MNPSVGDADVFSAGVSHVSGSDARIGRLVARHGRIGFRPPGRPFAALVESILSQQLNGVAADKIIGRVSLLFKPGRISPEGLAAVSERELRAAGVSPQKVSYLKDIASRVVDGRLELRNLANRSDEEIVEMMDGVRGVGRWTAQMVLIFALGRPDVLPVDDFGIRKAVKRVYGLRDLPKPVKIEEIAGPWHPYSTVACLYLWKDKDTA